MSYDKRHIGSIRRQAMEEIVGAMQSRLDRILITENLNEHESGIIVGYAQAIGVAKAILRDERDKDDIRRQNMGSDRATGKT